MIINSQISQNITWIIIREIGNNFVINVVIGVVCGLCVVCVWCGVVWCGVVWCGVVWCGVVWFGVVWCVGMVCVVCDVMKIF